MRLLFLFLVITHFCALGCSAEAPEDFSVVVYNVENLFDVDGVALFEDYQMDEADDPFAYTRRKMLTKLETVAQVLSGIERGGPEVLLLQELEADFTPDSAVVDFDAFLEAHSQKTVYDMIVNDWKPEYGGISAAAWLLKILDDIGIDGYHVAVAPSKELDSGIAHANAIFSRFPISQVHYHAIRDARDIIEAELDVDGHSVWIYNNHWKSGASNPEREPIRVDNAKVLRRLVEARLKENPQADIIIGGDLNAHYNHSRLYPEIQTGINSVLKSQAIEGEGLYNLWYEISPEHRYSEVWQGRRGSLMHIILAPGLYDESGLSYVDGSFRVVRIAGLNADAMMRPREWNFAGQNGGGASDHFPLVAKFRVAPFETDDALNRIDDALDYEMRHDSDPSLLARDFPDGRFLNGPIEDDLGGIVGRLYSIEAEVLSQRPLRLSLAGREWSAYAPAPHLREKLKKGEVFDLVVSYGFWRGQPQLVVEAIR